VRRKGGVMLGGRTVKQIYELQAEGCGVREIARRLGLARNSVRKYLRAAEVPRPRPRRKRGSKLDPYVAHLEQRLTEGVQNGAVLLREVRAQGYAGSYALLKAWIHPRRRRPSVQATRRFETLPGAQAQVDWGVFRYRTPAGTQRTLWAFVLVLSWSRALYVEFVRRADVASFLACHVRAFQALGGIPQTCLYDNAKVVVLGRDETGTPLWNSRFLDASRRLGFDARLCRPYRPQTKGRVESGVKYLRGNFWPTARFTDEADLNHQVQAWIESVAHQRVHGTTGEQPAARLALERSHLQPVPPLDRLRPLLREERTVGRDGYVAWERAWYGVAWSWVGQRVQVQADADLVQIWAGDQPLAVHPVATRPGQRLTVPGQWAGLPGEEGRPRPEPLAVQLPRVEVEQRPLSAYDALIGGVGR
jgi:transposase